VSTRVSHTIVPNGTARKRRFQIQGLALLAPPLLWMLVFYLIPLLILLVYAFWSVDYLTITREFTLDNFRTVITNDLYPTVLLRTIIIASIVTLVDIALAFPVAYFLARKVTRHRQLMLMLVIFPLWSSYLVRAFAWRTILGTNGVLNSFLTWTGVIDEPLSFLLFSKEAMVITFAQVWLPFMILPLYTVLDQIPSSLLEASADLGASSVRTFQKVILPLALPGIVAGSLSVFSLTMGDYITPTLIGGPGDQLIGRIIADNFGTANNWPLGAALVVPLLIVIFAFLLIANRFGALGRSLS
jgi:spermidine/putrescine transport system permease protein